MSSRETAISQEPKPLELTTAIPIACIPGVFTNEERTAHLALSLDALARWPLRRQELPDGYSFEYEGDELRFAALARWIAGEHRCCPWACYSLEMGPFMGGRGAIRVRVRATAEGVAFLRTCYEYIDKLKGAEVPGALFDAGKITHGDVRRELDRCETC